MATASMSETASGEAADMAAERPIGLSAWYALAILTLVYTLHSVDRSVMSVVIEPVKAEFRLTDSQIGILTGLAYGCTYAIASLPLGYLIDRVERRKLLSILVAVWSGCTAFCGIAQNYMALLFARLAVGMAEAGGAPTSISIISDLFPPRRRTTAISIFWASTALGTAASFIVGSIVAVHYGWRAAFMLAGLPGLALAAILFFTVTEPPREGATNRDGNRDGAPTVGETLRYALARKLFVHNFIGMTLNSMMLSGVLVWQASFMVRVHHLSLEHAGLLAGLAVGLFGGVGALAGGPLGDRMYKRGGVAALPLAAGVATFIAVMTGIVFTLSGSVLVATISLVGFELVGRTYVGPAYSAAVGSLQPRMRGLCISAVQVATNLIGYGFGPYLAGVVSDRMGGANGIRWGLATLMLLGLWSCIHYVLAWRAGLRADLAAAGE